MKTVHIKNLDKFNPGYKDRELIWCKVYFAMVNANPEFEMLCEIDKWRFIAFIILELQTKQPVPIDNEYLIRKGFNLKKRPIALTLQMLHNSIEVCNAGVTQNREEKRREEKNIIFRPPSLKDISQYIKEKGYTVDPKAFFDYFEESGWVDSKGNKVRNWKQKIITWQNHQPKKKETGWKQP